jgi:DNA repair protein RecO (recombination protein O)
LAPFGESDAVTTFLTESAGKIAAVARGARKSSKRFGGALEPMHTLDVEFDDRGTDLVTLKEASIGRARLWRARSLEALEAAGSALRWARALCPDRTPEPDAFAALVAMLDALDEGGAPRSELAIVGLRLLAATGFGMELDQCVQCGRACPADRAACVDPARGGLVCMECGGARAVVHAPVRAKARAALHGEQVVFAAEESDEVVRLVEIALAAHAEIES